MPTTAQRELIPAPPDTPVDERRLVREAMEGSQHAFRALVELYMREIYNTAFRFVQNHHDADDIAQETFVRAYEALPSFRGDAEFGTWLYRIAANLSLNCLKSSRRRKERDSAAVPEVHAADDSMDSAARHNISAHIERALHELPTLQRAAVILRHVQGLSTRQVSEILNCSEGTVKTHLFRGMKKLRKQLGPLKEEIR